MDRWEACELLRRSLGECRKSAYADLAARVGAEEHATVVGASGTAYQIETMVFWDNEPGGNVRVVVAIDDGGWRAWRPLNESLIMTPDGSSVGEEAAEQGAPADGGGESIFLDF